MVDADCMADETDEKCRVAGNANDALTWARGVIPTLAILAQSRDRVTVTGGHEEWQPFWLSVSDRDASIWHGSAVLYSMVCTSRA